ncbi:hypothetical protein [Marinobacter mangrovi]|nr:hypothetical protein [Marinobacter mangrovi]
MAGKTISGIQLNGGQNHTQCLLNQFGMVAWTPGVVMPLEHLQAKHLR